MTHTPASAEQKVPKVLHYCWFGKSPMPALAVKCMESWKRILPEYSFNEWNEDTFDVTSHPFVRYMYDRKKWAFVTDYVRLWAVNKHGGVYFDADVEAIRPLDAFLHHDAFTGFELWLDGSLQPFTAVFGARAGHPWVGKCLKHYDLAIESRSERELFTTNTKIVSDIMRAMYVVKVTNCFQLLGDGLALYPSSHFCTPCFCSQSYAIHHFSGSWIKDRGFRGFRSSLWGAWYYYVPYQKARAIHLLYSRARGRDVL